MKRILVALLSILLVLSMGLPGSVSAANTKASTPQLQKVSSDPASGITEYKLTSNGLQVLLAERHHTPLVTVMVVYHVGSRNEAVGYTGSTHFLEHMMFRGTSKHDPNKGTGIDDILKPMGGINNATTSYDRTNYYETLPSQDLNVALEFEADRMRNVLLRQEDHNQEMTVVRNELERNEDEANQLLNINVFAHAFLEHPYHHPIIGWRSDVEGVPVSRLRTFYNDFYYPNNATLVVIGDFKTADAIKQIIQNFGRVPKSPRPFPEVYTQEPPQIGERRFVVRRGEDLPKVQLAFHIPKAVDKDTYALEVASALLGDDRRQSSRLYKALVDTGMASDCYAYNYGMKDPALFTLMATATPGTANEKIEETLYREAQKLGTEPISDEELEKAKKSIWKRLKLDASDPMGMASQLAEAIAVADWHWWANFEKNIKAITKEDVAHAAKKYFSKDNETVGYYYPTKPAKNEAAPPATPTTSAGLLDVMVPDPDVVAAATESETAPAPATATGAAKRASVAAQVKKRVLKNGMTVLALPVKGVGVVSVAGKIRAGEYFRPTGLYSVPDFTAEMLDKGSAKWTKEALARQLELMGSSLNFNSSNFWMSFNSDVVSEDVPQFVSMLSDTLRNPLFLPEELDKARKQTAARIQQEMNDTGSVASNELYSVLYKPECVYYEVPYKAQLEELPKVSVDHLRAFYKAHITPANTVLAVVGDIEPETAFKIVEENFASWSGGPADKISVEACASSDALTKTLEHNMQDKTNVDVLMARPFAPAITAPDFYAASIANSALGHDTFASRLGEVRTKHGLTYGIGSYFTENAYENGSWVVSYSVAPSNLNKSFPIVKTIIDKYVKEGITAKELSEEARRLGGEYTVERMRTPHQLADAITKYEFLGMGAKFMDEYPIKLSQVTRAQVNAAIRKYFDPNKTLTAVAGTLPKK